MLMLCAVLMADALAQSETTSAHAQLIEQPEPDFPMSELRRGREGWVVLRYSVDHDGMVVDPSIEDSSGSDAFDEAAMETVREWRYESGAEQSAKVLLSFVYERKQPYVTKSFFVRNRKVHRAIGKGKLDEAQELIDAMRSDDELTAFELAYFYIAEGRIADEKGDPAEQLRCFRKAMLSHGRWLPRNDYLKLLYAAVVLEIQLEEYSSALRDYALLSETRPGRALAADLEEPVQAIEAMVARASHVAPPYMAANMEMSIERERIRTSSADRRPTLTEEPNYPTEQPQPTPPQQ